MRPGSRREEVLAVIVRFRAMHGVSPTCTEVRELMGAPRISLVMIVKYCDQLEKAGRLSAIYASGKRSPRSLYPVPSRQVEMWGGASSEGRDGPCGAAGGDRQVG